MPKSKDVPGTEKKTAARRTKKVSGPKVAAQRVSDKGVSATTSAARRSRSSTPKKPESNAPPSVEPPIEPSISEAQSQVVASKFAGAETVTARPGPRPTLPASYGESHLLLLVRDPQTLFAAWDMAPSTIEALKARIGRRGFAVSTLTLRLTRAGGGTSEVHVGKKARSRYLKIDGGPSFIAEIGFTTPAGRFEPMARSAPCFVPMGPVALQESIVTVRRAVLGYREARAMARRGAIGKRISTSRARPPQAKGPAIAPAGSPLPRVLGGASDLYRR